MYLMELRKEASVSDLCSLCYIREHTPMWLSITALGVSFWGAGGLGGTVLFSAGDDSATW